MSTLIVLATFSILLIGGHGGGFLYQYFFESPSSMFFSPWGQSIWAALALPFSAALPYRSACVIRWLSTLLLASFFVWLYLLTEEPALTFGTAIPLVTLLIIQSIRCTRFQRHQ